MNHSVTCVRDETFSGSLFCRETHTHTHKVLVVMRFAAVLLGLGSVFASVFVVLMIMFRVF